MVWLARLASAAVVAVFTLIVLGGVSGAAGRSEIETMHRGATIGAALLLALTALATASLPNVRARTRYSALAALAVAVLQTAVGAAVDRDGRDDLVAVHLAAAMLTLTLSVLTVYWLALDRGAPCRLVDLDREATTHGDSLVRGAAGLGAVAMFLLLLSGATTSTATGAALACPGWPLCYRQEVVPPAASSATILHLEHRAAALVGIVTVATVWAIAHRRRAPRGVQRLAGLAVVLICVQSLIGGGYVLTDGSAWLSALHLVAALVLWLVMLGVALAAGALTSEVWHAAPRRFAGRQPVTVPVAARTGLTSPIQQSSVGVADRLSASAFAGSPVPSAGASVAQADRSRRALDHAGDYLSLTKPGILSLLLTTTLGGMVIAAAEAPPLGLVLATLLGGAMAAGGANALNCYIDRDIDAIMSRTRNRPAVTGRIAPRRVLLFGLALTVGSVLLLGVGANWLAASLALAGNAYYVLIYTRWLKRRTPHNVVVGGAAGAVPPLVGWAAATGSLTPLAWALFAVIFAWTPPHSWALALLKRGDYDRAAVPMLPVVAGEDETRRQIALYSALLFAVCLMMVPLGLGPIYLVAALILNIGFLGLALRLLVAPSKRLARHLFFYSLWYLAFFFAAAVADRLILA